MELDNASNPPPKYSEHMKNENRCIKQNSKRRNAHTKPLQKGRHRDGRRNNQRLHQPPVIVYSGQNQSSRARDEYLRARTAEIMSDMAREKRKESGECCSFCVII